jgi:hypothetical protein
MNAERRAWSFEQWTAYFVVSADQTLLEEILTHHTIDLNHPVAEFGEAWIEHCTVLGVLCGVNKMVASVVVVSDPGVIDWNAIAIKCVGEYQGKPSSITGMPVAVLLDNGCLLPFMFRYCDPCAVAKKIPGVYELSGLACYVENACKRDTGDLCMDRLFHEFDALPMPVLHVMAFEAQKTSTVGSLSVLTHIQAHIRWREENMARQRVALWLGGDVKSGGGSELTLWKGNSLGEAIATRMQYSYKQYTEEEEESRKNGHIKRRKI